MTVRATDITPGATVTDRNGVQVGTVSRVEEDRFSADVGGTETWLPYSTAVTAQRGEVVLGVTAGEVPGAAVTPPGGLSAGNGELSSEPDFASEYDQVGFALADDRSGQPRSVEEPGRTQEGR